MSDTDVVQGALKLLGNVEAECIEDIPDLLKRLPSLYSVEIPATVSNVVVSPQQPGDDQRDNLWVRLDNGGNFIGLYVYAQGQWRQVTPVPNQIFRVYGDSRQVQEGFILATESPRLTTAQKVFLELGWLHSDPADPTSYYTIFDVLYVGY